MYMTEKSFEQRMTDIQAALYALTRPAAEAKTTRSMVNSNWANMALLRGGYNIYPDTADRCAAAVWIQGEMEFLNTYVKGHKK